MRRSRLAAVCVLISALLLGGCGATAATEQHTVALVAKSTQTEFWLSVFAGAEAAATEYNLKLTIPGPGGHGVGDYVRVRITGCTPATLFGEEISEG